MSLQSTTQIYFGTPHGCFGSLDESKTKTGKTSNDTKSENLTFKFRTVFIIDDEKRLRLIFGYPAAVGLNTAEVLRMFAVSRPPHAPSKRSVTLPVSNFAYRALC